MKTISLPKVLRVVALLSIIFVSISVVALAAFIVLTGLGVISADADFTFFVNGMSSPMYFEMAWPIYFQLEPASYSLQSAKWGAGEVQLAQAEVFFSLANSGSAGLGIQMAMWYLLVGILIIAVLLNLYRIFSTMDQGTPFVTENVGRIRWVAGLLIFYAIVLKFIQMRISERIFWDTQAEGLDIVFQTDFKLSMIMVGLIIFALAEVFRYGLELQTEADLTV